MYFGESKHPGLRRPDPEKDQLAEQNALLKKLLRQQTQDAETARSNRGIRGIPRIAIFGVVLVVIVGGVFAYHVLTAPATHRIEDTSAFPVSTIQQIQGFNFYYFQPSFQTDFVLQRSSVNLQAGVLVFQMKNPTGQTLAFTEEATPSGYDTSSLQADKQFTSRYGQAFITDAPLRTTGTLFTSDNTWILVNAPKPIGADLMQQVLDALQPVGR